MWPVHINSIRDALQTVGLFVGLVVAVVGLRKALYEVRASRQQRVDELLWKRINTAKELLEDIHKHDLSKNAVRMLDLCGCRAEYEIGPKSPVTISYPEVLAALQANQAQDLSAKEIYIRECFDWFFFRVDRIEHYIRRTLIDFDDVQAVFKIYAREFAKQQQVYDEFLDSRGYELAKDFFKRYLSVAEPLARTAVP